MHSKAALITGGAKRIGAAISKALHKKGFKVIIHCHHSLNEANDLAEQLNKHRAASACVLQQDLSAADAANALMSFVIAQYGRIDLLVNNASCFKRTSINAFAAKDWQQLFHLNAAVPFQLSLAAYPWLAAQQGLIINITDIHADRPLKGYAVYCQTKAALTMQTKALAREFAPLVRVNAIAPGAIAWPEDANQLSLSSQQEIIAKIPLKKHGEPAYIAAALMSFIDNPYITGQVLNVDGGRSIVQ